MATLAYDNSKVTAALINSLTGNQVTTFVNNAPKFAAAVAAGKSASIAVGKTTLQFSASKSPAVAKVLFNINGTSFDPIDAKTFTAAALIKAAAAQFSLTTGIDAPLLTTDNNTINAPVGTWQAKDVVSDPSSTDTDVLNGILVADIKPTIRNIETINLDVQSPAKVLDAALITHDTGATINFSSSANLLSLSNLSGLTRNVGLSFASGNWSIGGITSSDPNTTVQSVAMKLNGTNLTISGLGGTTQATDIDILSINSAGTSSNIVQLPDGVDINESGEAIVVSGKQALTLRTNNVGANGINISKSNMSGLITLELTSLSVPTGLNAPPALDFSSASIDTLRLYGDQVNAPITLVSGATVDLRRDQLSGITLNTQGALNTANDVVTLSLTDDNPSATTLTDGVIDIGSGGSAPGIDLTGYQGTGIYANQFESLRIVLAAPPLTSSTASHKIGLIKGGVVNGTAVSISGPDNLVVASVDEKVLSVNASSMSGRFTLNNIDTGKAAGRSFTGGSGTKDTLASITSTVGVTANLSTGVVNDRGTNNSLVLTGFENLTFSAGDDSVTGSLAAESLNGALGNDSLTGGAGNDTLTGSTGNDTFTVDSGTDTVTDLGTGDVLVVSAGAVATTTVTSTFVASTGTSNSGTANLTTSGLGVDLSLASGTAGFTVTNSGAAASLVGSANNDTLSGGTGNDSLNGSAGNDSLTGGAGNDSLTGGEGADTIAGGTGADTIILTEITSVADTVQIAVADAIRATYADFGTAGLNAGDTFTVTGGKLDAITGMSSVDVLDFLTLTLAVEPADGSAASGKYQLIRGDYVASTNSLFTVSSGGADTLVLWSDATNGDNAVVLVGVTDAAAYTIS